MVIIDLFIHPSDAHNFDILKFNYLTPEIEKTLNYFLYFSAKYLLVHHDTHFNNYQVLLPVIHDEEGNILGLCELMYNSDKKLVEIYNICIHPEQRQKGYCKQILQYIFQIQNALKCDLWIAVSTDNPLYNTVTEIYRKAGFVDNVEISYLTPSNIVYERGFLQMFKIYKE